MDVYLLWVLCVVKYRSLRRAYHSSRGVLPTVLCRCVWSRNHKKSSWMRRRPMPTRGLSRQERKNPITGLDKPWDFQGVEAPRFQDNRHMKVVRLSGLRTAHHYPQVIFLVLFSVRSWVNPRVILRPEGLYQWNIPMIPSGIEPATFRLVAHCLKPPATPRAPYSHVWQKK